MTSRRWSTFSAGPPGGDWCTAYDAYVITSLAEQNPEIYLTEPDDAVWYVIAAWDGQDKTWCGTEFGLEHTAHRRPGHAQAQRRKWDEALERRGRALRAEIGRKVEDLAQEESRVREP